MNLADTGLSISFIEQARYHWCFLLFEEFSYWILLQVPDFVETMIFDSTNAVITTGRYASREEATRKENVINEIGWWYKPWFYTHVATALKRGKFVEYVPAREYHHRHTRSLYWEGALIVPMGNHPLFRFLLGWLMPPKVSCQRIPVF